MINYTEIYEDLLLQIVTVTNFYEKIKHFLIVLRKISF